MPGKNAQACSAYRSALEMEEKGKAFYEKAAGATKNPVGQKMFQMFAEDEGVHHERIQKIFDALSRGKEIVNQCAVLKLRHGDLHRMFRDLAREHAKTIKPETSDLEALEIGIDLELHSISFYEGLRRESRTGEERAFLTQMIEEEKSHHTLFSDMKLYLTDTSAWYIEKERHGMDGA